MLFAVAELVAVALPVVVELVAVVPVASPGEAVVAAAGV